MQKHPRQMRLRQFVPPAFVTALLGMLLLSVASVPGRMLLAIIVCSYFVANLAASIWTARKGGGRPFLLLPIVFGVIHLSYGFGFLIGLVKFWNRWRSFK